MDTELRKDTKDYKNYEIQNTTNLRLPAAGRDDYQYYELIKKEVKAFGFGVSKQCATSSREVIMQISQLEKMAKRVWTFRRPKWALLSMGLTIVMWLIGAWSASAKEGLIGETPWYLGNTLNWIEFILSSFFFNVLVALALVKAFYYDVKYSFRRYKVGAETVYAVLRREFGAWSLIGVYNGTFKSLLDNLSHDCELPWGKTDGIYYRYGHFCQTAKGRKFVVSYVFHFVVNDVVEALREYLTMETLDLPQDQVFKDVLDFQCRQMSGEYYTPRKFDSIDQLVQHFGEAASKFIEIIGQGKYPIELAGDHFIEVHEADTQSLVLRRSLSSF